MDGITRLRVGNHPVGIVRLVVSVSNIIYIRVHIVVGTQSQVAVHFGTGDGINAILDGCVSIDIAKTSQKENI